MRFIDPTDSPIVRRARRRLAEQQQAAAAEAVAAQESAAAKARQVSEKEAVRAAHQQKQREICAQLYATMKEFCQAYVQLGYGAKLRQGIEVLQTSGTDSRYVEADEFYIGPHDIDGSELSFRHGSRTRCCMTRTIQTLYLYQDGSLVERVTHHHDADNMYCDHDPGAAVDQQPSDTWLVRNRGQLEQTLESLLTEALRRGESPGR